MKYEGTPPSDAQMHLLELLPGVLHIYKFVQADEYHAQEAKTPQEPQTKCDLEVNKTHNDVKVFLCSGPGGIPVLPNQFALALISGGIDSPLAAYKMMTRGCRMRGVHFLNSTNDTAAVFDKMRRIAMRLSEIQGTFTLYFVDISMLQAAIVAEIPNKNRTIVYKYFMLALSCILDDSKVIVTGDSLGQVASQTIDNLSSLYSSLGKAVLSPLIGTNKKTIMREAQHLGTFDISVIPASDCCQYMMCKTHAQLSISRKNLQKALSKITVPTLPVVKEEFSEGQRVGEATHFPLHPALKPRDTAQVKYDAVEESSGDSVLYFDAAAGAPLHPDVAQAMLDAPHGNPGALHQSGRQAKAAIELARAEIAAAINVSPTNLIFTSGGTESNNLALRGCRLVDRLPWSHSSTHGDAAPAPDAPVVRIVDLVNHETGSISSDLRRPQGGYLHVDACQALCKVDMKAIDLSQVDSMSISAHKINGPQGVAALYVRDMARLTPMMTGGSQEYGKRPGTENVPGIVGFAAAVKLDRSESPFREVEAFIVSGLENLGCRINRRGPTGGFIVHATLPEGFNNVDVVSQLSSRFHIEVGTGSACKTTEENTTVYDTLGIHPAPARRSLRVSYDYLVDMEDAGRFISAITTILSRKSSEN